MTEIIEVVTLESMLRAAAAPPPKDLAGDKWPDDLIEGIRTVAEVDTGPLYPFGNQVYRLGDRVAKQKLDSNDFSNWHYDRKLEVITFDLRYAGHTVFCSYLLQIYEGLDHGYKMREYADEYIEKGYGFFLSQAPSYGPPSVHIPVGGRSKLSAQEKMFFRSVKWKEY